MADATQYGLYVPTSNVWDVSQIYDIDNIDPKLQLLLVRLYQNLNSISIALNLKDTGYYNTQEYVNGQLFYPNPDQPTSTPQGVAYRQVFRKVINFGALPNAGAKSIAHNLPVNAAYSFTRIYATSTDPVGFNYIPIPYASAADSIELSVDSTDVTITTVSDRTAFTITYVILEYMTS